MNITNRWWLPSLLLTAALSAPVCAQDEDPSGPEISTNTANLVTYLLNLGTYMGFDLTQQPQPPVSPLLSSTVAQLLGSTGKGPVQLPFFNILFDTVLGAIPVNMLYSQIVPTTNSTYSWVNDYANATFPSYNSGSAQQPNTLSANTKIDQPTLQQDPVSQAVLNILGTPDYSYCMDYTGTNWTGGGTSTSSKYPECAYLNQYQVQNNVIGTLPNTYQFYTYSYNQQFLSQLNGNTLIAPLLYSTTNSNSSTSSSPQNTQNNGLQAQTQMEQAANFIRYAGGEVAPLTLPQLKSYDTYYNQAMGTGGVSLATQMQAQAILVSYFTKLRMYAALSSIGYSNLYYMLARRMPQNSGGADSTTATSQALNEFTMATWRLYTPEGNASNQWLSQINTASTATVQKEMATLLAEINYQLYLTRQQQERLLLTNTMLLMVTARTAQPIPPSPGSDVPNP